MSRSSLYRVINVDFLPNCVIQNCFVLETAIQKQPARNSDVVSIACECVWRQGSESSVRTTDFNIFHLIWFWSCCGMKTGIDFDHNGFKSAVIFEREPRERINLFVFSTPNDREREVSKIYHTC